MAERHPDDAALLALAFVESLVTEDGGQAQAIAQTTTPSEWGQMFQTSSMILAALLEAQHGVVGAVERIHSWRDMYLSEAAS